MKQTYKARLATRPAKRILITILCAGLLVFGQAPWFLTPNAQGAKQEAYESYYRYLEGHDYPNNTETGWHEDVQGITHDESNWFITQTEKLWKIPVSQDLNSVSCSDPGVLCKSLSDYGELTAAGYSHMGDPEFFKYQGQGYLLIPLEFGAVGLAAFRADTLEYIDHVEIPGQTLASWCAINPQGVVYSSNSDGVTAINRFSVSWNLLKHNNTLTLAVEPPLPLSVPLGGVQGGVVTPSGELLFMVAGGIHVFDLSNGNRIIRSTNDPGFFSYEYWPDFPFYDEPEGLTIWDLDGGQAPGIRGQLHVLLLNNDAPDDDNVLLKHYTHTIFVDHGNSASETGAVETPFNTVAEALGFAWEGTRISIKGGSYPETMTTSKRVQLTSWLGPAIIGQ